MTLAQVVGTARKEGRTLLTEVESKQVLKEAGIPVTETVLARSADEAATIAQRVGFPVVLKIVSVDIVHKSDVGGVKLNLGDAAAVKKAYEEILASAKRAQPNARVQGVSVQRMAKPGVEVIMGASQDAQFGPVLMFGLGGVMVEVLKDVAFRVVPLNKQDAHDMVREIKGFAVLQGARGAQPVDVGKLEEALLKLSAYLERHPEVREVDLNPVFAYGDGIVAVDARVVVSGA
jgi:acyl-CoA synthetase (NDP forming)